MNLKQSTSITLRVGPFLDEDDGKTAEPGLTINQADIRLSKAGGAFAQSNDTGGATHDENGWYYLTLNATDTNTLESLDLAIHVAGALPVFKSFMVMPANAYDSMYGSDKLEVDVTQIGGDTQSATDLKDFADAGYDPATNKVEGVKTVDTLTGHTPQTGDSYARLGAPVGASISADLQVVDGNVDDVLTDTNEMQGKLPTNNIMGSSVKTDKDDEIDSIKSTVDTNLDTTVSSRGTADPGDAMDLIADAVDASSLASSAVDEIVDATWDEDATGHQGAGSFGETIGDSAATGISIHGRVTTALPNAAPASSGGLATVDASNYVAGIQGTKNQFDDLNDVSAAQVNAEVDTALSDIDLDHLSKVGSAPTPTVGSNLDKVMNKDGSQTFDQSTDSLEAISDSGGGGLTAQQVRDAMKLAPTGGAPAAGSVDEHLDDILADTADIQPKLGTPASLGDGATVSDMLTAMAGKTASAGSYDRTADSQEAIRDRGDAAWTTGGGTGLSSLATGTAQGGALGYITLAAGESAVTDFYKGTRVLITGGTGAGQARFIKAYNGTSKQADVSPNWRTAPSSDSDYEIQAADANLEGIEQEVVVGNVATLSLKQLDLQNPGGSALVAKATGGSGHGIEAQGAPGGGNGIQASGNGSSGDGMKLSGSNPAGAGLNVVGAGSGGVGAKFSGGAFSAGINAIGGGGGDGILAQGGGVDSANSGDGIAAVGGSSTTSGNGGAGFKANGGTGPTVDGAGFDAFGAGSGAGIKAYGGDDAGHGIEAYADAGGAGGGSGLRLGSGGSHAMYAATGSGHGIYCQGGTGATDAGLCAEGNNNNAGQGMRIIGGTISNGKGGVGLYVAPGASASPPDSDGQDAAVFAGAAAVGSGNNVGGHGLKLAGGAGTGTGAAGSGLKAEAGSSGNAAAINAVGNGSGAGIQAQGGASGNGLRAIGGSSGGAGIAAYAVAGDGIAAESAGGGGDGISATGDTSGHGIRAQGGTAGDGVFAQGGSTSGHGIEAKAGSGSSGDGLVGIGDGPGAGIDAVGGATGRDLEADEIGAPTDLGDGASLSDNMTSLAGKTSGAGSYDRTTDSQEAIRDRGDVAWITGGGGTGLAKLSTGTAQAGAAGSITLAATEPSTDDYYKGEKVVVTAGTGVGQARIITGYTGSSKVATVAPDWKVNPDNTSQYELQAAESNLGAVLHDGVDGNNATLKLAKLDIQNPGGSAIIAKAMGGSGDVPGLDIAGYDSGAGIKTEGGSSGAGMQALGGTSSGHGIHAQAQDATTESSGIYAKGGGQGHGIDAQGASAGGGGHGIRAEANGGNSNGLRLWGNGSGHGFYAIGGGSGGSGGKFQAGGGNVPGLEAIGQGTGAGVKAKGGDTAPGLLGEGGDSSGNGIQGEAAAGGSDGIKGLGDGAGNGIEGVGGASGAGGFFLGTGSAGLVCSGGTNKAGLEAVGSGDAPGIKAQGYGTGAGIEADGGGTSGPGIETKGGSGGIGLYAHGENQGIYAKSDGTGGYAGIHAKGGDASGNNGPGMEIEGGTSGTGDGHGLRISAGYSGNGVDITGGTNAGSGFVSRCSPGAPGNGIRGEGSGSSAGILGKGGQTGPGIGGEGGDTSGPGIKAEAVSGNSHGLTCVGFGTGKDLDADEIDDILADTAAMQPTVAANLDATVSSRATPAQVESEVAAELDELITEPSAGTPGSTGSIRSILSWLWVVVRNKGTMNKTLGEKTFHNSSGTPLAKKLVSDDGTTYQENAMTSV